MFSPTLGTLNSYIVFPLNLVLQLFSQTLAPVKRPARTLLARVARGLHEGTLLNTTYLLLSFLLSHGKQLHPQTEAHFFSFDCPT